MDRKQATQAAIGRAVEAWCELRGPTPRVEAQPLSGGRHSSVVHLRPGGRSEPSAVAKVRPRGGLVLERQVHEEILPALGVETPAFLGFSSGSDFDVLFLEYVGEVPFEPTHRLHQEAAGRWLGSCHAASMGASLPAGIPRRSIEEDRAGLEAVRGQLAAALDDPVLDPSGRSLVRGLRACLDRAAHRWSEWAALSAEVPAALTHGAFITRNVRMREAGGRLSTLPFDWDHVAVRSPAVDLARIPGTARGFAANASLDSYRVALASGGLPIDASLLASLAALGTVIRAAACIGWSIGSLTADPRSMIAQLEHYHRALAVVVGE